MREHHKAISTIVPVLSLRGASTPSPGYTAKLNTKYKLEKKVVHTGHRGLRTTSHHFEDRVRSGGRVEVRSRHKLIKQHAQTSTNMRKSSAAAKSTKYKLVQKVLAGRSHTSLPNSSTSLAVSAPKAKCSRYKWSRKPVPCSRSRQPIPVSVLKHKSRYKLIKKAVQVSQRNQLRKMHGSEMSKAGYKVKSYIFSRSCQTRKSVRKLPAGDLRRNAQKSSSWTRKYALKRSNSGDRLYGIQKQMFLPLN